MGLVKMKKLIVKGHQIGQVKWKGMVMEVDLPLTQIVNYLTVRVLKFEQTEYNQAFCKIATDYMGDYNEYELNILPYVDGDIVAYAVEG
jgi:hypothetical protein